MPIEIISIRFLSGWREQKKIFKDGIVEKLTKLFKKGLCQARILLVLSRVLLISFVLLRNCINCEPVNALKLLTKFSDNYFLFLYFYSSCCCLKYCKWFQPLDSSSWAWYMKWSSWPFNKNLLPLIIFHLHTQLSIHATRFRQH